MMSGCWRGLQSPRTLNKGFHSFVGFLAGDAIKLRKHPKVFADGQQTISGKLTTRNHIEFGRVHFPGLSVTSNPATWAVPWVGESNVVRILIRVAASPVWAQYPKQLAALNLQVNAFQSG